MAHPFEVRKEVEIEASPDEVWEAITTGKGMDAWFMGSNQVEPHLGGAVRTTLSGFTMESTITVWDPPNRLVTSTGEGEDGAMMAFEYVVEGREGGTTLLRLVHSGFLAGDDWETEYDALREGDPAYVLKLAEYLKHFRGRTATPVSAMGPKVDRERAWSVFGQALGLGDPVREGDPVHARLDGLPEIDGVVDYVSRDFLGVRTADAMYRFIHGFDRSVVLGHHVFADIDQASTERAWQSWLARSFG